MPAYDHDPAGNRILSALTKVEYRRLRPGFELVALEAGEVLFEPGVKVEHIYFFDNAIASLLVKVDHGKTVEVAMEGNEGAVGFAIYLGGVKSNNLSIVRNAGTATRMEVPALIKCAEEGGRMKDLLHRYAHALTTQVAQLGVCGRFHNIETRLARWLLMTQDRVGSREFHATQESIAHLLGVRRSGITAAANGLHRQKVIDYRRGQIEILDKRRLRAASCSCYGIIKRQYDSFLE